MSDLKRLIEIVEAEVSLMETAHGGQPDWLDQDAWSDWRKRCDDAQAALKEALLEAGAKFNARPAVDFTIRLGGIRSTSTSGIEGAVRNWLTAARKRLPKAA